jgi:cytochrome c biogenesis protein CcdA
MLLLAYLGGILTILSPCILPVPPFVFARSDRPFLKSGLPLLAGMAATFALVASLATVAGGWAVRAHQFGRIAALLIFAAFGFSLRLSLRPAKPLWTLSSLWSISQQAFLSSRVDRPFPWVPVESVSQYMRSSSVRCFAA